MAIRGYTKLQNGKLRAWVRVASRRDGFNEIKTKTFPAKTRPAEIQDWRAATRTKLRAQLKAHRAARAVATGASSGFAADVIERYLPAVTAMPTYRQRVKDMHLWIAEFGTRDRHSIQPHEIRAVRERWLTVGPKRKLQLINGVRQWVDVAEPLSASSVNHRLRALSNFFTVLDPGRPNPVHAVPEADEPRAIPRAVDYETIRRILDTMADRGRPVKGETRPKASLAKVRARVMAWTGLEPTELGRVPEQDLRDALEMGALFVPGRRKGAGAEGRVIPLNEDAMAAIADLVRLEAWGPFRGRAVLRAWQIACRKVLGRSLRLKDLRHSFVTATVRGTKELTTAQLLAGHTDPRTTRRYALAAMLPLLRAGIDAFTRETTHEHDEKHPERETTGSAGRSPSGVHGPREGVRGPDQETGGHRP